MTTATTTRLITTLRALAEECEHADEGTPGLGRRVEAALGFAEGGRIATDVGTAVCLMPSHQEWAVGNFPGNPHHFSASLGPWRYRVHTRCATVPLAVCAVMLKLEAAILAECDL